MGGCVMDICKRACIFRQDGKKNERRKRDVALVIALLAKP